MKSLVFTAFYKNFSVIKTLLYFKTHLKTAAKPINTGLTAVFNLLNCQRRDYEFKNVDSKATQDLSAYHAVVQTAENVKHIYRINFATAFNICMVYLKNGDYEIKIMLLIQRHLTTVRPNRKYPINLRPKRTRDFMYRVA